MTIGENDGQRFSMRVDTGPLFGSDETRAWVAAVRQEATDWVQGSARNEREHVAAKLVSSRGRLDLTSYLLYDSIHEDTYQRLYSEADFRANPRWDRLVGDWPGVPYLNQFYRPGWQTRRNNTFGYLKADWSFSDVTSLSLGAGALRADLLPVAPNGTRYWTVPAFWIVTRTADQLSRRGIAPGERVRNGIDWRPQRDSNPCLSLERAGS